LLTQSIFLLSVSHFLYVKEVDKKIVIDNAVKLAKKYVDVKDYAFVNAILDKVL
jgi:transcription termination factor NusB